MASQEKQEKKFIFNKKQEKIFIFNNRNLAKKQFLTTDTWIFLIFHGRTR